MLIASWLTIMTAALQLAPLAVSTVMGIRNLLAADPNVPAEFAAILNNLSLDNHAALTDGIAWIQANPKHPAFAVAA